MNSTSLPMIRDEYVKPDVCGPCGGNCCKTSPGASMPEDFGSSAPQIRAVLKERLASGDWSLDWWEGDPREGQSEHERAYFPRPATVSGKGDIFDPSYGGRCALFDAATGCRIFETRPAGCRGVEPKAGGPCLPRYATKQDAAAAWLPYAAMMLDVAEELGEDRDPPSAEARPFWSLFA